MFDFNVKIKNKSISVLLIIMFLLVGVTASSVSTTNTYSDKYGWDIIVPDDYSSIQNAIDNANPGDKILVRSGVYNENIVVDKEGLLIRGENKYNTILDGCKKSEDDILVSAENVMIQGLTIMNARSEGLANWQQAGIKIYTSNCSIKDNIFIKNRIGVHTYTHAYNLTISENKFIEDGILLADYFNSKDYPKNTLNDYIHDISNNTVNGRPLYYFKNKNDFIVPNDAGQIILVNCTYATIKDLYMTNSDFSIFLAYCSNCIIENITVTDSEGEILLEYCENVSFQNNIISNTFKGICLEISSKNILVCNNDFSNNYVGISVFTSACDNIIQDNNVYNNEGAGIEVVSYHGGSQKRNIISNNSICDNRYGIYLAQNSTDNTIKNNKILRNSIGIVLLDSSENNNIEFNSFEKNIISATFLRCTKNDWNNNYWNRPRFLPKTINGFRTVGKIPIPWANFDWHPTRQPYDI